MSPEPNGFDPMGTLLGSLVARAGFRCQFAGRFQRVLTTDLNCGLGFTTAPKLGFAKG